MRRCWLGVMLAACVVVGCGGSGAETERDRAEAELEGAIEAFLEVADSPAESAEVVAVRRAIEEVGRLWDVLEEEAAAVAAAEPDAELREYAVRTAEQVATQKVESLERLNRSLGEAGVGAARRRLEFETMMVNRRIEQARTQLEGLRGGR